MLFLDDCLRIETESDVWLFGCLLFLKNTVGLWELAFPLQGNDNPNERFKMKTSGSSREGEREVFDFDFSWMDT